MIKISDFYKNEKEKIDFWVHSTSTLFREFKSNTSHFITFIL